MRKFCGYAQRVCGWLLPIAIASTPVAQAQVLLARPNLDIVEQSTINAIAQQPDGGVIVAGDFTTINGTPRAGLARLAPDGTLDPVWNPAPMGPIKELAVDADGDVYAAAYLDGAGDQARHRLVKLDGAGSGTPVPDWDVVTQGGVATIAVDGADVFVGGWFTAVGGQTRSRLAKLSAATGAVDPAWAPALDKVPLAIVVTGQLVYVGGVFDTVNGVTHRNLARFARGGAGALDANWNASPNDQVIAIASDGAGTLYVSQASHGLALGQFVMRVSLATGQVDPNWRPVTNGSPRAYAFRGGSLYIGGGFTQVDGAAHVGVARFTLASGALDPTWTAASPQVNGIAVSADGSRILVGGPGRENALPQPALKTFDATGTPREPVNAMKPSEVTAFARMNDGGLMIGGRFAQIDGHARMHLARLLPDGTLDTAWRADADYQVFRLAANAAGEIYVGGSFSTIAGQQRLAVAKFSADGVLDALWNPAPTDASNDPQIESFAFGGDGSVYVGGRFSGIGGQVRNGLAKLDGAGTGAADATWNPYAGVEGYTRFYDIALDDGNHLYIGGLFPSIGGQSIRYFARLAATGTGAIDAAWNPAASDAVTSIALRGRSVYVAGYYASIGGLQRRGPVKLSRDGTGSADTGWNSQPTLAWANLLALDGAGNVYAGGSVYNAQTAIRSAKLARISRAGALDTTWTPDIAGRSFETLFLDRNGLYIGGDIDAVGGQSRIGAAALDNDVIFGDGVDP